ncbi:O-acyltransferase (WSD1-like) family protein [Striga hermonthica]|uniref:O-acyltransferase (WSD1-like) family protein n=1 Tax=Striga hermonthica TaxID=68872 RepID=A0A9N7MQN5_STRHE|nr:O-acyltransferase (WSD1-like) family protein [Striga hermonthica]
MSQEEEEEENEPATPIARLMQAPAFNFCIIAVMGFRSTIDLDLFKQELGRSLLRHARFTSVLIVDKSSRDKFSWRRTKVDIENHVFALDLDPNMESPDEFVEHFTSEIMKIPMVDMSARPAWEFHVLNVKTSEANSIVVLKMHHSIGDAVSLMSLLMTCAEKITTNCGGSLPILPSEKRQSTSSYYNTGRMVMKTMFVKVWIAIVMVFNTFTGLMRAFATLAFLKDEKIPINRERGKENSSKRFVHRIVDFDDIKLVKTAMNATVNDVGTGVVQAGLTRYLNIRYGQCCRGQNPTYAQMNNFLPKSLRLTSVVCFNLRPYAIIEDLSDIMEDEKQLRGKWGNKIGGALVPLDIVVEDDPLAYVIRAKAVMDQKKLSFEPQCMPIMSKLFIKLFGIKAASSILNRISLNTTLFLSNVMGPREEITPFGHPLCYIAPIVSGFSQVLFITFQSYANKFIISIAADENLVPNPHQLCDDMLQSLQDMKNYVQNRAL